MESKNQSVAAILRRRRRSLKLSLADVELATKIRGKYLIKLEAGDYANLPNDIYSKGFVKNYADYLDLDVDEIVNQYLAERGGSTDQVAARMPRPVKAQRFVLTPKILVLLVSLVAAGGIMTYLYWQFSALAAAPKLEVTAPVGDQVIYGSVVDVAGHVGGGADVTVNDAPLLTDGNGNFSDKLALQDGVNTIRIQAKNKVGKSTTISRSILAHLPKINDESATVPTAVFDGVAVGVTVKGAAIGLVVEVDGREAFKGTMLDGTAQTFKGSGKIKITTTNAGATSVVITNTVVAGKSLSPLGQTGEVKRNLEFAKDTNFQ